MYKECASQLEREVSAWSGQLGEPEWGTYNREGEANAVRVWKGFSGNMSDVHF